MVVISSTKTAALMQADIEQINSWAEQWLVKFNSAKSESLFVKMKIKIQEVKVH